MKNLNQEIKNKYAYRKQFPGAKASELGHYAIPTLKEDKPDICIIDAGTNSLYMGDSFKIVNDILDTVNVCKSYGVNDIYVSTITHREQYKDLVSEINNTLKCKQFTHDYSCINNDNIGSDHIWRDKIHLNYNGTCILAKNFITCINKNFTN